MLLPVLLIIPALLASAFLAYGTHPAWAQINHGVEVILWSRRLQWPLIATAVLFCMALLLVVISGKRKSWWLIALLPVLALFSHRFITGPKQPVVIEDPTFVSVSEAAFLKDSDAIIGVRFGDINCAFPYAMLFDSPVVVVSDRDRRMVLLYSPFANRMLAYNVTRDVKGSDLEIVSNPANATLVYNNRLGQFINSVTGLDPKGDVPKGFKTQLVTTKTSWITWKAMHADGRVMSRADSAWQTNPRQAVMPVYPMPKSKPEYSDFHKVCVVATTQPIVIPSESIGTQPLNLSVEQNPVAVFRDSNDHSVHAFGRKISDDLVLKFSQTTDAAHPEAKLTDVDTATSWSITGAAVDGPKETKGKHLNAIAVDDGVYWGVLKFWLPQIQELDSKTLQSAIVTPTPPKVKPTADPVKRKRKKTASP